MKNKYNESKKLKSFITYIINLYSFMNKKQYFTLKEEFKNLYYLKYLIIVK